MIQTWNSATKTYADMSAEKHQKTTSAQSSLAKLGIAALALTGIGGTATLLGALAARHSPNGPMPKVPESMALGRRSLDGYTPNRTNTETNGFVSHVGCLDVAGSPPCADSIIPVKPLQGYISMCMMMKDDPDFPEWLSHHRRLSIEAFYIYEHNSTQSILERMPRERLDRGDLRYQYINNFPNKTDMNPLMSVYSECMEVGKHHPWMVFIDADEFLVPSPGHVYLPDYMRHFEGHCALIINWMYVGSNNHTNRPQGGLVESYTKCAPKTTQLDYHTKVIGNPALIDDFVGRGTIQGPHQVHCRQGTTMVTEDGKPFHDLRQVIVPMENLTLYHYIIKSAEEFQQKVNRGGSTNMGRAAEFFHEVDDLAQEDCFAARDLARVMGPNSDIN